MKTPIEKCKCGKEPWTVVGKSGQIATECKYGHWHWEEPTTPENKCKYCEHESCETCFGCHNIDCTNFGRPFAACWKKLKESCHTTPEPNRPQESWEKDFRLLMGKVVGWRDAKVDYELEDFIKNTIIPAEITKARKEALQEEAKRWYEQPANEHDKKIRTKAIQEMVEMVKAQKFDKANWIYLQACDEIINKLTELSK